MIERQFMAQRMKEYQIEEFVANNLKRSGHSHTRMQRTPLGEKIIVYTSRPGLVVGRSGQNIRKLTKSLKKKFNLENPEIEISEVQDINLDARIVAERIASSLEKFGSKRFKGIMHKSMEDVMNAGAIGVEIILGGKIPSSRAKSWRVYAGYLKKCGDVAISGVKVAHQRAELKTGTVGIKVHIMPPDIVLPDKITLLENPQMVFSELPPKPMPKKMEKPRRREQRGKRRVKKEQ